MPKLLTPEFLQKHKKGRGTEASQGIAGNAVQSVHFIFAFVNFKCPASRVVGTAPGFFLENSLFGGGGRSDHSKAVVAGARRRAGEDSRAHRRVATCGERSTSWSLSS